MTRFDLFLLAVALAAAPTLRGQDTGWIRGDLPGFAVYSDLSAAETRMRIAALQATIDDFERVWPMPQTPKISPGTIVFCQHPEAYVSIQKRILTTPFFTRQGKNIFFNTVFLPQYAHPRFRYRYPPLIDSWGNHLLQRAYSGYFQDLMGEREMPWLVQGSAMLLQGMVCGDGDILLPPLETDETLPTRKKTRGSKASLQAALDTGQFLKLSQLFGTEMPPPLFRPRYATAHNGRFVVGPDNRGFWRLIPYSSFSDEAYEVIRFGLFGDGGRHRLAFIRFALASSNGPLDEADFKHLLGMDDESFLQAVWQDTSVGSPSLYSVPAPAGASAGYRQMPFSPVSPAELQRVLRPWSKIRPHFGIGDVQSDSFEDLMFWPGGLF